MKKVSWFSPDKLEKDSILDAVLEARKYAKGKLLDVGCGEKPYESIFKKRVNEYIGLDKEFGDIKGSALHMPIENNSFNTVLCTQVLEHVNDPQKAMNEIYRVLKKGGHAILTVPLIWCLHEEPEDYFRFTKYALRQLAEKSGFNVVYIKEKGNWATTTGQFLSLFMETTLNRYFLKYPKRLLQTSVMFIFLQISKLPTFKRDKRSPLGYVAVLKK